MADETKSKEMIRQLETPVLKFYQQAMYSNPQYVNWANIDLLCAWCGCGFHWCNKCDDGHEWIHRLGYCSMKCLTKDYEGTTFKDFQDWAAYLGIKLCPDVAIKAERNAIRKSIPTKGV